MGSPNTPTLCKRRGERSSLPQSVFSWTDTAEHANVRNRSTSMFETLPSPKEITLSPSEPEEEKPARRSRTFSVHDVILHNQKNEAQPPAVPSFSFNHL